MEEGAPIEGVPQLSEGEKDDFEAGTFSLRASLYNGVISLPALLLREYGLERSAGALSLIVSYVSFPVRYRLWETGNVCETGQAGGGKSRCCSVWAAGWLVMTLLPSRLLTL